MACKIKKCLNGSLNIAMLGHKSIPSREGGIEIVVEELAVRMVGQGHTVTCYNRQEHRANRIVFAGKELKEYRGIRLRSVFTIKRKGLAAMSSSFFAAVRTAFGKYDIVHFHAEGPCAMLWLPKLLGKRCVATIHGIDWAREKWRNSFGSRYIHFGEKIAAKYADEIIVLSTGMQEYFKKTYGRETQFISNGVNYPVIRREDFIKKKWGLEKDEFILFLGRLVPEKGLRYLIKAFKDVETDKKLVIAGGTSDTDDFMTELIELADNDERIIFTGFVQGQVLDELYSNAYIYTLPSDLEGMPMSLLEAMSYGNCCIVSSITECTEVVEDKAEVFKKGNVKDLKEKMQMLCDDGELVRRYKNGASDFICKKYNWNEVVKQTIELYRR
ncbi:glycosyltransferase family 4 protein [Lacrimispora sp. NSJ-141]|uniref:Glycosyltransferase family 4 protein n=1 Tax=Lientehia hominis TaxID=2897778 RepID=A0AAP2RJ19_9FIRM|nr:glycosyltransferase family 4 protein [Lientehia hominis]MCD2492288.1 glycosyltransferase family 4 protein [Lientehia hominis]